MDVVDDDPIPPEFNNQYFVDLLVDLENLTAQKAPTAFALPDDSIWNTLKLTSLAKKNAFLAKGTGKIFSLERDIQRINASVGNPTPPAKRVSERHLPNKKPVLNTREKLIEARLLEQYREDPDKYRALLENVEQVEVTKKKKLKRRAEELNVKLQAQDAVPVLSVEERLQEAATRRVTMLQDQQEALDTIREERRARHSTIYIPTHVETAAIRAERATQWSRIISTVSRVALLVNVMRDARHIKAQDIRAWNAALYIQRFWRAHFFRRLAREAAAVVHSRDQSQSGNFMSSVGSQRLRRATRSEKMSGNNGGNNNNAVADEMQMQLVRRLEHAMRVDAALLIATFLGDIEKTFKNRILKFRRIVKFLQIKVRAHISVSQARAHTLAMWLERHLPALALHIKIVTAGRGLDLNNLTANDRENLRLTQQHYKDYKYRDPHHAHVSVTQDAHLQAAAPAANQNASAADGSTATTAGAAAEEERRRKITRILSKFDLSLMKQMNTVSFHEFLRNHLEQIHSSDFHLHHLTNAVPATTLPSTSSFSGGLPHAHSFNSSHTTHGSHHAVHSVKVHTHHSAVVKYNAIMELIVRKRRECSRKLNQKAEVVYEKLRLTIDDARSFIKGERDPLSARLREISLAEAVEEGVRLRQQLGTRRQPSSFAVLSLHPQTPAAPAVVVNIHNALLHGGTSRTPVSPGTPPRLGAVRGNSNRNMNVGASGSSGEDRAGLLKRGASFKASAESSGAGAGPVPPPPSSPGGTDSLMGTPRGDDRKGALLKRGASFKRPAEAGSPGAGVGASASSENEVAPLKRGTSSKGTAPSAATPAVVAVVELPPPNVFLLLSSVTAQDMLLLYIEVADRVRRQAMVDKLKKRTPAAHPTASAAFGHGHHVPLHHQHSGVDSTHHLHSIAHGNSHNNMHEHGHHLAGDIDEHAHSSAHLHVGSKAPMHRRPSARATDYNADASFGISQPRLLTSSSRRDSKLGRSDKTPHAPFLQKPSAEASLSMQKRLQQSNS